MMKRLRHGIALLAITGSMMSQSAMAAEKLPNLFPFLNSTGILETYNAAGGPISLSGPFFQVLGTNGRSCVTCHRPAQGWSLSSDEVKLRFELTRGKDPLFRTVDGSVCNDRIDTSTLAGRRKAYSLLLDRGLIRVEIAVPENAEFTVASVENPYGCDSASLSRCIGGRFRAPTCVSRAPSCGMRVSPVRKPARRRLPTIRIRQIL